MRSHGPIQKATQSSGGITCGQVAQVVERSPEKAGVGGSTPSRGTTNPESIFHPKRESLEVAVPLAYASSESWASEPKGQNG